MKKSLSGTELLSEATIKLATEINNNELSQDELCEIYDVVNALLGVVDMAIVRKSPDPDKVPVL